MRPTRPGRWAATATLALALSCSAAQPQARSEASTVDDVRRGPLRGTACNGRQLWSTTAYPMAKVAAAHILGEAVHHGAALPADVSAKKAVLKATRAAVFWWMIRTLTVEAGHHNSAALPLRGLTTASGAPLWLVRGGYTARPASPGSCYGGLVHRGRVRHVLNLYDGEMVTDDLDKAEATVVRGAGGTYAHPTGQGWRGRTREAWRAWRRAKDPATAAPLAAAYRRARAAAAVTVAATIKTHLLRPGDAPPRGHLLVHCGGGMHRTGMVVGVLDRCINGAPMARIEADYKRHVGWKSAAAPGGFEAQNLDFVAHFPCALIRGS